MANPNPKNPKKDKSPQPPAQRDQTQPLADEKAPSYDEMSAQDVIAHLSLREPPLTQVQKDHINNQLGTMSDPEAIAVFLRLVARAVDAGTPLPEAELPPETEESDGEAAQEADGGGDGDGSPGGEPEVAPGPADGTDEGGDPDGEPFAESDPGGVDDGLPYPNLSWDQLLELIRDEGGASAVDRIDQRVQFVSTTDALPYLRAYAWSVVEEQDPPPFPEALAAEGDRVAAANAARLAAIIHNPDAVPEGGGAPGTVGGPPPMEQPPLGEVSLLGYRTGQKVRVQQEDRYGIYNGHVGFIEAMTASDTDDDSRCLFTIRFQATGEDPGERVPADFRPSEISPVVE